MFLLTSDHSFRSALSDGLASIDALDEAKARALLAEHWQPFLAAHDITPARCHYTSRYYEPNAAAAAGHQ